MKRSALHLRRPAFREGRPAFVVSERQGAVAIAVVHFSDDGRVVFFVAARAIACGLRGGFSYASMLLVLEKWYLFRDGSATMAVLQRRQASVRIRALSIGGEQGPFFMPELFFMPAFLRFEFFRGRFSHVSVLFSRAQGAFGRFMRALRCGDTVRCLLRTAYNMLLK